LTPSSSYTSIPYSNSHEVLSDDILNQNAASDETALSRFNEVAWYLQSNRLQYRPNLKFIIK